ncbi:MAG: murein biosynthesis integral membrane protein MurJ [Epsilonproteobacteria bacterium]|nr:murein biosynthesis integral membrane protein MurJ [Campylobacterota bacterium]
MFLRSIFTNSFGILTSRVFGLIRDLLTASILGANIYSDMFFVAFKLPNLFRRIFAEGAFTQSFLPAFARSKNKGAFALSILIRFLIVLAIFTALVNIFDTFFTKIIAMGFSPEVIKEAAPLVAINFYYLILIFFVTFLATLLQYKNHFATTAFSTALLNISIIGSLLISKGMPPKVIVYYMSYAVVVGGVLQLIAHFIAIKKLGLDRLFIVGFEALKRKKYDLKDELNHFYSRFFPSILGNSTAQLSAFIDTYLATFLSTGSISYLYYANRVFQLPLALFAIAVSVAIFPKVAKYLKNKDTQKAHTMIKKSFWLLAFLLSLSTVGGMVLSKEIITLLFQRGAFTSADTAKSAFVLSMYMVGLLPFGLAKIFSLWLYSLHKQKTAAKISSISLGVNIALSLAFIIPLKAAGLALASSVSGFVLFYLTVKEFGLKHFLDIIADKKAIYLVLTLFFEVIILFIFKDFIDAYI